MRFSLLLLALGILAFGCTSNQQKEDSAPSLKEVFKDDFYIGAAVNPSFFTGRNKDGIELVKKHFNALTAENSMKWERLHPEPGVYDFELADAFIEFAEENDMYTIGHTLVWHSQTPDWVFRDEDGNLLDREALLDRMRDHIQTVVGRYKGRVDGWDVVNEAISDSAGTMRESLWYQIIGEDYVAKAFEFAHEADPEAELYYNDYSLNDAPKREGVYELIKSVQEQGARVTGIGMQGHYGLDYATEEQLENSITRFSELGVVAITELDMDVLPSASDYRGADVGAMSDAELTDALNPYTEGLPDSVAQQQADQYAMFFRIFLKHSDNINRVTFWGVTDAGSWKNNWPIPGRTNYPLILDREGKPKPAFDAIVNEKQKQNN
ncbi:endo-1,4-beta-xylanase [Gracilimonas mengyeensis]|uniref:Beta-xylanase n=1 Tax=Gracilimonas mengyeensis TaxID=1302730 RepID=A0A521B6J1_9BACT|nr:endo-1,4-beta-xylanase [Gracilimonas mengyeensis]SMO42621.1 endo-1,4-beta-xylanase [Gracilimonas mengyeensis]